MPSRARLALPALVLLLASAVQSAAPVPPTSLANPSVRLWYEETGRLSGNLLTMSDLSLWNTIIGEGSAEENANDAIFTVEVHTQGEQNISQPLVLTATDARGKVLASRTITNILTSEQGRMTAPLWVRDIGCAGHVVFSARQGSNRRSVAVDFNCGE